MHTTHPRPHSLGPTSVAAALSAGATVIDGRAPELFDAGHVARSVNVPAGDDAGALAAHLVGRDVPVIAFSDDADEAAWIADQLDLAGFRSVLGSAAGEGDGTALGPHRLHRSGSVDIGRLAAELATGAVLLVDVRDAWESCEGRIPGSVHLPLASLRGGRPPAARRPHGDGVHRRPPGRRGGERSAPVRPSQRLAAGGRGRPDLLARPLGLDLLGAA